MKRAMLLSAILMLAGGLTLAEGLRFSEGYQPGPGNRDSQPDIPEGLEVGPVTYYLMSDSPVSGPVETFVLSNHPIVYRGSVNEVQLAVQNHSNEGTVTVNIDLDLAFADGVPVEPFHLGMHRSHTLGPNEGVGFRVYFAVPEDAPLGNGTFRAKARVGRVTGDPNGHPANTNPMIATDGTEFEVIDPPL